MSRILTEVLNALRIAVRSLFRLKHLVDVKREERRALFMSFAYFFFLLTSYFILRPIRDEVAAASGVQKLPWLFGGTLAATLVFTPIYTRLVVRHAPRRFIVTTYQLFAAQLVLFYVMMRLWAPTDGTTGAIWTGRGFFVWTSVFNLFIVSIFWSFMADIYRSEQAKRLFGFIGVGGTLGSITGSALTAVLAQRIGTVNLLLVSTVLLEVSALVVYLFPERFRTVDDSLRAVGVDGGVAAASHDTTTRRAKPDADGDSKPIGGTLWAGVTHLMRSRYLLMICLFLILYTIGSTFLYFGQSDIVGRFYTTRDARTAVLAKIELWVQVLTVMAQLLFTGRIIKWLGLATTLSLLPALSMLGFGTLAMFPVFPVLAVFVVLRRGTNFALTNPAMEVLFTVVPREEKYKAKNFIETFVYRGGDQIGAWVFAGLSALGLSLIGISMAAVPLAAVWFFCGHWLGREHGRRASAMLSPAVPDAAMPASATLGA